jgi:hypothetical protein
MIQELLFSWPSRGACAVTLVLAAALSPMFADAAAPAPEGSPEANYRSERADCLAGRTQQDQKTCLYEAVSARDAARKGLLTTETPEELVESAKRRCQVQPAGPDRVACERMAQGEGTVSGSVAAGGEMRELTTVVPATKKPKSLKRADRVDRVEPAERPASSAP